MKKQLGSQIVADKLERFPTASTLAIARMLWKEHKAVWISFEAVRSAVRLARGGIGKARRKYATHAPSPFSEFPDGMRAFENWSPVQVADKCNALVLADIHIPFHEREPLMASIEYGKKNGADVILLNGDAADCFAVSFWDKDPRHRNFPNEVKMVKDFLRMLRNTFKRARIIYKLGNHEERYERYMRVKAPELLGISGFKIGELFGLAALGIEVVEDKRPVRLGDLNVIHGHEYRFAISNPVNPARGLFLRAKEYALCGHFHQSSYHTEKTVEQNVIATWSTGCLCDLHPDYMVMNNWCHGFAFVEVSNNGKFNMIHKVIRNGKVY